MANAGPVAAATVVVTDTLPAGVTFVSATGGGTLSGNVVTWPAIASLASGASQGYSVTVTAPATGRRSPTSWRARRTTADPNPGNNNGSAPGEPGDHDHHRGGRCRDHQDRPGHGDRRDQLQLRDHRPERRTVGRPPTCVVTDTLPAGVTFVSATGGGTLSGNVVTWPAIASLANGASQAYTVTVTAPATGTLLNIVASTSSTLDSDPANNNGSQPGGAGHHDRAGAGRRGDHQDRPGHGERRGPVQLHHHDAERRARVPRPAWW